MSNMIISARWNPYTTSGRVGQKLKRKDHGMRMDNRFGKSKHCKEVKNDSTEDIQVSGEERGMFES